MLRGMPRACPVVPHVRLYPSWGAAKDATGLSRGPSRSSLRAAALRAFLRNAREGPRGKPVASRSCPPVESRNAREEPRDKPVASGVAPPAGGRDVREEPRDKPVASRGGG